MIIFGLSHLPAAAATVSLTLGVIAYIVVGNYVGGILFGWLSWRRSLEAAMFSRASAHVVFIAVSFENLCRVFR